MKLILLTGNDLRHEYFRKQIAKVGSLDVLSSYCESNSLEPEAIYKTLIERQHFKARKLSEVDFFQKANLNIVDYSNPSIISKGRINDMDIVDEIIIRNPDIILCYGASIIKSKLLDIYKGRFVNVHLGLSPYYRGSGTNIWPLIDNRLDLIGATFMHIDKGIDTGKIIHQIRGKVLLGDSPHSIGNRLIKDMVECCTKLILNFNDLCEMPQLEKDGKLFKDNDFDEQSCQKLYNNLQNNIVEKFINSNYEHAPIIKNTGLIL
jgi:phosphoribosylglycinamide formyltransferase 1